MLGTSMPDADIWAETVLLASQLRLRQDPRPTGGPPAQGLVPSHHHVKLCHIPSIVNRRPVCITAGACGATPAQTAEALLLQARLHACQCIRHLSCNAKSLRSALVDNDIAAQLFRLLEDADHAVQASAVSTLGNFVLDFCPVKVRLAG